MLHIDNTNFDEVMKMETPVIIDFWAEWCGPCQMMGPVFEKLSGEFEGKLTFAKLNTDEHPELAQQFGIMGIPALVMIKKGQEVDRIVGFAPEPHLRAKIEEILSRA